MVGGETSEGYGCPVRRRTADGDEVEYDGDNEARSEGDEGEEDSGTGDRMRGEVVPQRIAAVDPVAMGVATEWEEAAAVLEAGMEEAQKRAEALRASMKKSEAHKDFAKAEVARVAALAVDGARRLADPELRDKLEKAARRAALAARAGPRGDLRIPAGGKLLDMYDPEFWPSIFYDLFTFGDNVPWLDREAKFPYDDWAAHIQWREEPEYGGAADACEPWVDVCRYESEEAWRAANDYRPPPCAPSRWCLDFEFLAVVRCLQMRTTKTNKIRAHIERPGFGQSGRAIAKVTAADVAETVLACGPDAGVGKVLRDSRVPGGVKAAMKGLVVSMAEVVGTDAARVHERHVNEGYRVRFGPGGLFITPNLADTRAAMMR